MKRCLFLLMLCCGFSWGRALADNAPPTKLLLVGSGPDGHPAQTHEYMAGLKILAKCLKDVPGLEITTVRADEPWKDGPELIARADGVVLFLSEGARWMNHDPKRLEALEKMAARGGGITVLHWAMGTKDAEHIDACLKLLGGCHGGPDRKYKILETEAVLADHKHPIAAGIEDFRVKDEFYYRLKFVKAERGVHPLLRVTIDGQPETVAWCWERPTAVVRSASVACTSTTTGACRLTAVWSRREYCGRSRSRSPKMDCRLRSRRKI